MSNSMPLASQSGPAQVAERAAENPGCAGQDLQALDAQLPLRSVYRPGSSTLSMRLSTQRRQRCVLLTTTSRVLDMAKSSVDG
jgi:hypothetical protein